MYGSVRGVPGNRHSYRDPSPLVSRPSVDIEVSELQVLIGSNSKTADFRTFISNHIIAEILPGISTYLPRRKAEPSQQRELFPKQDDTSISQELLLELGSILERALSVYRHLGESVNKEIKSKSKPKKSRKKRKANDK